MNNLQLSKNFSFFELTNSNDFPQLVENNRIEAMKEDILEKLRRVARELLQPVRDMLGQPVYVLSGFRSEELNSAVGGSIYSQHMKGEACDFTIRSGDLKELCDIIRDSDLEWHQLIWYKSQNFIHISLATGRRDMQFIIKG